MNPTEPKDITALEKAFDNDLDNVLFFVSWVKNGRNATKAYLELNPNVDPASAQVMGSRRLAKIPVGAVMKCYGLGLEEYFDQLKEGLGAMKLEDLSGEKVPDHATRKGYHDKLGKLLGMERDLGISVYADKVVAILGGDSVHGIREDNSDTKTVEVKKED